MVESGDFKWINLNSKADLIDLDTEEPEELKHLEARIEIVSETDTEMIHDDEKMIDLDDDKWKYINKLMDQIPMIIC